MKNTFSFVALLFLFFHILYIPDISAQEPFSNVKTDINTIQSTNPTLPNAPSGSSSQKGFMGSIIANIFTSAGKIRDEFLNILDTSGEIKNEYLSFIDNTTGNIKNENISFYNTTTNTINAESVEGLQGLTSSDTNKVLKWGNGELSATSIYENGGKLGIGQKNPNSMLSILQGSTTGGLLNITSLGSSFPSIGMRAVSIGFNARAQGNLSTALGYGASASGDYSYAIGSAQATQEHSLAIGTDASSNMPGATAMGVGVQANSVYGTALGRYNLGLTGSVFEVGNGTTISNRSNTLTILNNGNTGIGTHTPTQELDVSGNINFTGDLYKNGLLYKDGKWSDGTSSGSIYYSEGSVGIGTETPSAKLDVEGIIASNNPGTSPLGSRISLTSPQTNIGINYTLGDGSGNRKNQWITGISDSDESFYIQERGTAGTIGPKHLVVASSGSVGIGIDDPKEKLHVNGRGIFNGHIWLDEDNDGDGGFVTTAGLGGIGLVSNVSRLSNPDLFIEEGGNVGIGTNTPSNKLTLTSIGDVDGANSGGGFLIQDYSGSSNGVKLRLDANELQVSNNGLPASFFINAFGGNVGIGTPSPLSKLHVNGNIVSNDIIAQNNTRHKNISGGNGVAEGANIVLYSGGHSTTTVRSDTLFRSGTINRMKIDGPTGNVGIGTVSPGVRLHVNGNARISGTAPTLQFNDTNNNDYAIHVNGNRMYFMHDDNDNFTYDDGENNRMTLMNSGGQIKLGIGTSTPTEKLDIRGKARITQGGSYDVWIQGGSAWTGGDNRNLAILGQSEGSGDRLILNYGGEYANGTNINGNLGIGRNATSRRLSVNGSIEYTGTITDISDIRLKTNVKDMQDGGLASIIKMRPVSFTMKGDEKQELEYGFIAQEIEKILPELVAISNDDMGTKSLNYVGMIPHLVKAIQEQQKQIEVLEQKIFELQ